MSRRHLFVGHADDRELPVRRGCAVGSLPGRPDALLDSGNGHGISRPHRRMAPLTLRSQNSKPRPPTGLREETPRIRSGQFLVAQSASIGIARYNQFACSCRSPRRSRTFTATIPQAPNASPANAYFTILARGTTFFEDWNAVGMGIAGDYVAFWLETLVEQLAPNTFLAFAGLAAASLGTSDMSTIALPFAGSIEYCVTKSEQGRFEDCYRTQPATRVRCESDNHQLTLTRR
jgi:hypothetical protein